MSQRARCPSCGTAVTLDAEWCPLCYQALAEDASPGVFGPDQAQPGRAGSGPARASSRSRISDPRSEQAGWDPTSAAPHDEATSPAHDEFEMGFTSEGPEDPAPAVWPCPWCGHRNPLVRDLCATCGTPFAKLFEEQSRRKTVDPPVAGISSLFLPGLGHIRSGRVAEGVARMVLFLWAGGIGAALLLLQGRAGSGLLHPLGFLFAIAAVAMYGASAYDAYRAAAGEEQLINPRALLYGSAGLVVLSVISLFVLVFRATNLR